MLFWFRNDLRTHDNAALHYFLSQRANENTSKAVFFISKEQWRRHDWSDIKIDFVIKHAHRLVEELSQIGVELRLVNVDTFEEQISYLIDYVKENNVNDIVANREVEYNETQRDLALKKAGVRLRLFESDVIVPKGKVLNKAGSMFKVFTPFKRAWLLYVKQYGFDYCGKINTETTQIDDSLYNRGVSQSWPFAVTFEREVLPSFFKEKMSQYSEQRDIPSIKGTSGISPYLAAGLISPRYVLMQLLNQHPDLLSQSDTANFAWLNELIWREFYRHLLFDQPKLCQHHCFNDKYQSTRWPNNPHYFEAWKQGKTGYPLVDAAMRQLNKTGWMHNRLRMVVASFLTKHLLIDWRWGEKYFMQQLIDGDLAANNGGWQWAASTGCDAQPYFRVFNPIRQSERFDPDGTFIRMYLPELAMLPNKVIHFPHDYIAKQQLDVYWPAIVEHKEARLKALTFYK